ncbi:hypothetical protein EVG20_g8815 [Dentipellis fragilis]|uniref:Uncharacterized protein n=1 Tax=Dentipellis fragilis TaxID=205917 RepID=A0A4Y9Y2P3_9AGAM|nr:hypothetical protein EVG20_g8815 [Dentipellis fragilis]
MTRPADDSLQLNACHHDKPEVNRPLPPEARRSDLFPSPGLSRLDVAFGKLRHVSTTPRVAHALAHSPIPSAHLAIVRWTSPADVSLRSPTRVASPYTLPRWRGHTLAAADFIVRTYPHPPSLPCWGETVVWFLSDGLTGGRSAAVRHVLEDGQARTGVVRVLPLGLNISGEPSGVRGTQVSLRSIEGSSCSRDSADGTFTHVRPSLL